MSIYKHVSYKAFLKEQIAERKRPGFMTELAQKVGCDRTYLSQVLSGKAQLTADHAVNLADALELDSHESDYFLLLVLKERSSNVAATKRIEARMERIRKENVVLTKKVRSEETLAELSDEIKLRYYRNWKFAAAHILSSVSQTQTVAGLAAALAINEEEAGDICKELSEMGLVSRQGVRFVHTGRNFHIPSHSPLVTFNHLNWRMRAMEAVSAHGGVHYTDVFSISKDDAAAFQELVLEFVERFRKKVRASGAERAYTFCCDLFPVAR